MTTLPDIAQWWSGVEGGFGFPSSACPDWMLALAAAARNEAEFRVREGRKHLEWACARLPVAWQRVAELLRLRLDVRECREASLPGISEQVRALIHDAACDPATRARAWHLLGTTALRRNDYDTAETAMTRALQLLDEGPARQWVLDGFGQLFIGQGAWEEARRTLAAVSALKQRRGDWLGCAISVGHLAQMELGLGQPRAAESLVRSVLDEVENRIPGLSRLRLHTLLLQALLDAGDCAGTLAQAARVQELLGRCADDPHYLLGYACIAMARATAHRGESECRSWLAKAGAFLSMPDQVAFLRSWEARLLPSVIDDEAWRRQLQRLFEAAGTVTDAEVLMSLLLAERAADRCAEAVEHLNRALALAVHTNSRLLLEQVDRLYGQIDPRGYADRIVERFSGRSADEVRQTVREEATLVFVDLVSFTPRSLAMPPDEVMVTVRSLFELATPLLARHRLRPLQYVGDGLLAISQGADHRQRAIAFADGFIRRTGRVTLVRKSLGEAWGLDTRAGIATGPVTLGAIGSHLKLEFTAIGLTTNLAARLQSVALPGEIVSDVAPDEAGAPASDRQEEVHLKGFGPPVRVRRLKPDL